MSEIGDELIALVTFAVAGVGVVSVDAPSAWNAAVFILDALAKI